MNVPGMPRTVMRLTSQAVRKPRISMLPVKFCWKTYVLKVSQSKFSTQHIQEVYLTTVSV